MDQDRIEETLKHLNSLGIRSPRKIMLNRLSTNKSYPILWAQKTTKLNKSKTVVVRLEIDDFFLYLPKRFNTVPNRVWCGVSDGGYEMQLVESDNKTVRLKFNHMTPVGNNKSHQFNATEYLNNFIYSPSYSQENNNGSYSQSPNPTAETDKTIQTIL